MKLQAIYYGREDISGRHNIPQEWIRMTFVFGEPGAAPALLVEVTHIVFQHGVSIQSPNDWLFTYAVNKAGESLERFDRSDIPPHQTIMWMERALEKVVFDALSED